MTSTDSVNLEQISALRDERAQLADRIAAIDLELQDHVRAAFDAGAHHTDIASAAGVSRARIFQIRKGTRR